MFFFFLVTPRNMQDLSPLTRVQGLNLPKSPLPVNDWETLGMSLGAYDTDMVSQTSLIGRLPETLIEWCRLPNFK